jgi:hypothetical protein
MVYSNNPLFTKEERVKHSSLSRQRRWIDVRKSKLAREYYKTITLNGKN